MALSANASPNISLPVLLGGFRLRKGCRRSSARVSGHTRPAAARSPPVSWVFSPFVIRPARASSVMFAGPQSKPRTPSSPEGGRYVMFEMPPRFKKAVAVFFRLKRIRCAQGVRGAPAPPAATSRVLKSLTQVTPVRCDDEGGVAYLKGGGEQRPALTLHAFRQMAHRLAVAADKIDFFQPRRRSVTPPHMRPRRTLRPPPGAGSIIPPSGRLVHRRRAGCAPSDSRGRERSESPGIRLVRARAGESATGRRPRRRRRFPTSGRWPKGNAGRS